MPRGLERAGANNLEEYEHIYDSVYWEKISEHADFGLHFWFHYPFIGLVYKWIPQRRVPRGLIGLGRKLQLCERGNDA
jgi:hypothetical protein